MVYLLLPDTHCFSFIGLYFDILIFIRVKATDDFVTFCVETLL